MPIAPRAMTRIRFAVVSDRRMTAITPDEAVARVEELISRGIRVEGVEIAGPGDPMATPHATIECLARLHRNHPDLELAVVTSGLGAAPLVESLAASGMRRLTLCVDAITTVTAEKIYAWIRPGTRTVPLAKAADILVHDQAATAGICARAGVAVRIATTVYPGFNEHEVEEIALKMAELGAQAITLLPYLPLPGDMGSLVKPDAALMALVSAQAARHLPVLGEPQGGGGEWAVLPQGAVLPGPSSGRTNVAVTSESGMDIDLHLGQASRLLIYGPRADGLVCLLETRPAPSPGTGGSRWQELALILSDCFALLTAAAGDVPRETLNRKGINVLITDGEIEGTVDVLYGGGKKNKKGR
ncbi:MAG: NifB/NifX family molybdenum-iron cluster-binding protein [Desulfobulbaceae bacterium]